MHIELHPRFIDSSEGQAARALTSACVHCGFCLATCPTYLDSRDERDSPRGRIYLIKQLLESGSASDRTQLHLDRCLTCRNCETTCPSGMQYGELLDIGRGIMEQEVSRPALEAGLRRVLRFVLVRPALLAGALTIGRALRRLLPARLRHQIPPRQHYKPVPTQQHTRKMLLLEGCVQRAATPATNAAARRVLDRFGITLVAASKAGCCGAVNYHLGAHADGLDNIRRNIDAWWPHIESGVEAIVSSATGCGAMLIDYGRLLASDPAYAAKAERVAQMAHDLAAVVASEDLSKLSLHTGIGTIAVHTPCTMQHALQQPELLTTLLQRAGYKVAMTTEKLLCCGSAGTYSILQSAISERVRDQALHTLMAATPDLIVTANIGCQLHLQAASSVPLMHWIELLDESSRINH
jgi:glycolate oxidase iron-sulfur subunit